MTYLGLPLSNTRLSKVDYKPLLKKKIQNKLAAWKINIVEFSLNRNISLFNVFFSAPKMGHDAH